MKSASKWGLGIVAIAGAAWFTQADERTQLALVGFAGAAWFYWLIATAVEESAKVTRAQLDRIERQLDHLARQPQMSLHSTAELEELLREWRESKRDAHDAALLRQISATLGGADPS